MTDRTLEAVCRMLDALSVEFYEVGLQVGDAAPHIERMSPADILRRLPHFKFRNARSANIFIRPANSTRYTLLDDLTQPAVAKMIADGFSPCAVVETSPKSFQAWLKHSTELPQQLATDASRALAQAYGGDLSAVGYLRFGRLAGFTNRKPKHRQANGLFPFVLLRDATGLVFPQADDFRKTLLAHPRLQKDEDKQGSSARHGSLSPRRGRRSSHLDLLRFRALPAYGGPAAADLAYAIAVLSVGGSETQIREELTRHYLSRDPNPERRDQYVQRVVQKAVANFIAEPSYSRKSLPGEERYQPSPLRNTSSLSSNAAAIVTNMRRQGSRRPSSSSET